MSRVSRLTGQRCFNPMFLSPTSRVCLLHQHSFLSLDGCGGGMKNQKTSGSDEKKRDKNWQTELEDSSQHWPPGRLCPECEGFLLSWKRFWSQWGGSVDKLGTCAEFKCPARWAEYTTAAHLYRFIQSEATMFGIHFCNRNHLDPVNQPLLIIIAQRQFNSFITTLAPGAGSSLSPRSNAVAGVLERSSCLILQRCLWLEIIFVSWWKICDIRKWGETLGAGLVWWHMIRNGDTTHTADDQAFSTWTVLTVLWGMNSHCHAHFLRTAAAEKKKADAEKWIGVGGKQRIKEHKRAAEMRFPVAKRGQEIEWNQRWGMQAAAWILVWSSNSGACSLAKYSTKIRTSELFMGLVIKVLERMENWRGKKVEWMFGWSCSWRAAKLTTLCSHWDPITLNIGQETLLQHHPNAHTKLTLQSRNLSDLSPCDTLLPSILYCS